MNKIVFIIIFLFLPLCGAFSQIEPLLQTAYNKLEQRNFNGALQDFNQILSIKPDNFEAYCGRAEARLNTGNLTEAMKDADNALRLKPSDQKALTLKGDVYFAQKDYNSALKTYSDAIQGKELYTQAVIGKAKTLNQLDNVKDAYKILDDAIESQPTNPELYYARGILNNSKQKYYKGLQDFEKSASLNPKFNPAGVALNSGIACFNLDELDLSVQYLTKAIDLDPTNATAYHSRGLAYYAQENYEESVKDFLKSNEISPDNHNILYNLGMAYYKLEKRENACQYFHKSCQLGNTNSCKMIILVCSNAKR